MGPALTALKVDTHQRFSDTHERPTVAPLSFIFQFLSRCYIDKSMAALRPDSEFLSTAKMIILQIEIIKETINDQ